MLSTEINVIMLIVCGYTYKHGCASDTLKFFDHYYDSKSYTQHTYKSSFDCFAVASYNNNNKSYELVLAQ